jgi:NitT/TauT family transport system permease protein
MTIIEEIPYSRAVPSALGGWINRNAPVLCVFAAIFAGWELAVRTLGIPDFILPSPSAIVIKIVLSWQLLLWNAFVTLQEILLGFGLSVAVAIPLAVAVVYSGIFERVAFPFMVSLQTIPKVALAPILVMWLGYGIMPKVMVAFLISFFPIVINSVIGMRSAEKEMIYLVQSMGAGELTTFIKIRLPKALPSIFGGLKVGMGQAVVGATVGSSLRRRMVSVTCSSSHRCGSIRPFYSPPWWSCRSWACSFSISSGWSSASHCRGAGSPRKASRFGAT